ncbi:adhesive domain-containing protein, partial [uncultured Enterococcus sp.]
MKKDYKKSMDQKARAKRRSKKYLLVGTSIAAGMLLGTAPISIATPLFTVGSQQVYADLISGQLFNNLTTSNTSGTTASAPFPLAGTTRNVDFVISANNGIDLSVLNGSRRAVLAIPTEMQGLVNPNGTGTFQTDILLPGEELQPLLSIVDGAVTTLVSAVENIVNLNPLASVNLDEVYAQLALLENLSTLTSAEVALNLQMQGDEYIYGELDGLLETIIREGLTEILDGINDAVQAIQATPNAGSGALGTIAAGTINTALSATIKPAFNLTFATATGLVGVGSSLIGTLADASVLGETTVTIPTLIQDPNYSDLAAAGVDMSVPYEAGFVGNIVKADVLSIDIASSSDGYSPVFYQAAEVTPPYNVVVTGNSTDGYEVTGMADPNATVRIYDQENNLIAEGQADENGNFTIPIAATDVSPLEDIQLIAYDENDNPSLPAAAVIPDDEEADA